MRAQLPALAGLPYYSCLVAQRLLIRPQGADPASVNTAASRVILLRASSPD